MARRYCGSCCGSSIFDSFSRGKDKCDRQFNGRQGKKRSDSFNDKMSYELRDIKRFDVVVYRSDLSEDEYIIKRVIGLPGEEIQIIDSRIYINGEEIEDKYHKGSFESGAASQTIKIGEDEYFVMGDNRNLSQDSRFEYVGNVKREDIIGRAWIIISPFNKIGLIK